MCYEMKPGHRISHGDEWVAKPWRPGSTAGLLCTQWYHPTINLAVTETILESLGLRKLSAWLFCLRLRPCALLFG